MKYRIMFLLLPLVFLTAGCATVRVIEHNKPTLVEVARSDRQWTGIAVARDGRIFVNYPRWSDNVPFSVGELKRDGSVVSYPDTAVNTWAPGTDPATRFVCVQSVVVDRDGYLWILDPASPKMKGIVPGGPKLVKIDLNTNRILHTYHYDLPIVETGSYLNDVRIDTVRQLAYITDSGSGAIILTDLTTGASRRLLTHHPSTHSEGILLTIEGKTWLRPDGSVPRVDADGIALSSDGNYLYYHALTGRTLYRIQTQYLRDVKLTEEELGGKVETVGKTGGADGMEYGPDGRIYVTALEQNAIKAVVPGEAVWIVVEDPKLAWPDSLAFGPDGVLYVTTSQINRGPHPPEPYKIFKFERTP